MIGIYHNADMDGWACYAIMREAFSEIKLIGLDYGDAFDISQTKDEDVIMADISLPMEEMDAIRKVSKSFFWVDHHVSAHDRFKKYFIQENKLPFSAVSGTEPDAAVLYAYENMRYTFRNGTAACELLWRALNCDPILNAVKFISMYDTYQRNDKQRWYEEILPFQHGIRAACKSPEELFNFIFTVGRLEYIEKMNETIDIGKRLLEAQQSSDKALMENSFTAFFENHRALCINAFRCSTETYISKYMPEDHDIMLSFAYVGNCWRVSLRSDKLDVSCAKIAEKYGGGGHPEAAGFKAAGFHVSQRKDNNLEISFI